MALVSYSSSSESLGESSGESDVEDESESEKQKINDVQGESDVEDEPESKKQKLNEVQNYFKTDKFPIPNFLKKSFKFKEEDDENCACPDKHDGRIRTFGHVRGNWASFAYIKVPLDFKQLQNEIQNIFENSLELKFSDDYHISLTKTLILQHHWINEFIKSIFGFIKTEKSFPLRFESINIYTNEVETRTFIGVTIGPSFSSNLERLTKNFDEILEQFKLEKFYSEPLFHTSILWCTGNQKAFLLEKKVELQKIFEKMSVRQLRNYEMEVETINVQIGNKYYKCNLKG